MWERARETEKGVWDRESFFQWFFYDLDAENKLVPVGARSSRPEGEKFFKEKKKKKKIDKKRRKKKTRRRRTNERV